VILEAVRADGLLAPDRPVVVLLSGGRDSVCLLDVAVRIAGAHAVSALHVNYGLRDAAGEDEAHCEALCAQLGVRLNVTHPRRPERGNLQAWARAERYAGAGELARGREADVAAGHTATDQVETILYRLASSPSRRALLGMKAREGSLVRPLLSFTREDTANHCRERGLAWRDDESNDSERFARGRVRGGLVPALEAVHPGAVANVLALAAVLREEAEVLDALVGEVLGERHEIELTRLRGLPVALARLIAQRLADQAAGGPAPGTARRVEELLALPQDAALDLPHGVRAVVKRGVLSFESRTTGGAPAPPLKIKR
jgi:tRNA(Ile)-lysidine synthase